MARRKTAGKTDGQTGEVWAIIQSWLDTFRYKAPAQNDIARALDVSGSTVSDWKYGRTMPSAALIRALAAEIGVPYERMLDAFLKDNGYRDAPATDPTADELLDLMSPAGAEREELLRYREEQRRKRSGPGVSGNDTPNSLGKGKRRA